MIKITSNVTMAVSPWSGAAGWIDFYSDDVWIGDYFEEVLRIKSDLDCFATKVTLKTFSCPDLASVIRILNRISVD